VDQEPDEAPGLRGRPFSYPPLMNEMAVTADHLIVIGRGRLLADCSTTEFIDRHSAQQVLIRTRMALSSLSWLAVRADE